MAAGDFIKFNKFLDSLTTGLFNLHSDTLNFALTNTAPTAATDTVFDPVTKHPPPAEAHGYTVMPATISSHAESGGTWTLATITDVVFGPAEAGGIGPFRYVILYDDTSATDPLIGYYDYSIEVTLAVGETFTVDVTASLLTIA